MEFNNFETEVTEFEFNSFHRMPSRNHGILQTRIARLLDVAYENEYSILTAVELELTSGRAVPDVAIYPKMHIIDWDEDVIRMPDAPLTAIEIISPRQAYMDLTDKNKKIYFPAGVKSTWIVMPALKTIYVYTSSSHHITFEKGILKDPATGIEISLDEIFK